MAISRSARQMIFLFCVAVLICGIGHVVFYGLNLFDGYSQFFCCTLAILWALSIQRRITDRKLRDLLILAAAFFILFFLLQLVKYDLTTGEPLRHCLWYAFYIPQMAVAVIAYEIAARVTFRPGHPRPFLRFLPDIVGALIVTGILTNDLHQQAFRFRDGVISEDALAAHGWLYYVFFAWLVLLFVASWLMALRRLKQTTDRRLYRFFPLVPLAAEGLYLALNAAGLTPRIYGIVLWQQGEMFGLFIGAFFESCIQLGMIPANSEYDAFFARTSFPAVIADENGEIVYRTAGADESFVPSPDHEIKKRPIPGGTVKWAVDLGGVRRLARSLEETSRQLETRNAYLESETQIKKERAEVDMRNRLYDEVSRSVMPQLELLDAALQDGTFRTRLPELAVTGAYIKRRSNMVLTAENGTLPGAELATAVMETLEYLRLTGVRTAASSSGAAVYPAEVVTAAYEDFGAVVSDVIGALTDAAVVTDFAEGGLGMRLLLKTSRLPREFPEETETGGVLRRVKTSAEGSDAVLSFSYRKGGEAS